MRFDALWMEPKMLRNLAPYLLTSLFICLHGNSVVLAQKKTVKAFILAGQSNMQGHGVVPMDSQRNEGKGTLEYCAKQKPNSSIGQWLRSDGTWKVREDVWIKYLDRHGRLTPSFGVNEDRIGPELGFGTVTGDEFDEPVLLIKIAWGGKSLGVDFRPPSAPGNETGKYYLALLEEVETVMNNFESIFPALENQSLEVVGFGWHQGWNDRVNQALNDSYQQNMTHFIRDLRKALDKPQLPVVIAETGMSGFEEKHPRAVSLMAAQAAVAEQPEFVGNVAFVGTKAFYRPAEESPSGQAYHWNTNAETYYLIGEGMGKAMLHLMGKP